jgi:hypothetical protein
VFSPGIKQLGRNANHSFPFSAQFYERSEQWETDVHDGMYPLFADISLDGFSKREI